MSGESMGEQTLLLLVGSNPLPNYLAACALRPHRIVLVYTQETVEAKDRLRQLLPAALGGGTEIDEKLVDDASCATSVQRAVVPIMRGASGDHVLLNYTGGTKVMAAHARLAFEGNGGRRENASYLDEGGKKHPPRLCFDDGTDRPLSDYVVPLTLSTVLALHAVETEPREERFPAPTIEDAREILCKVLANPALAKDLYDDRTQLEAFKKPKDAISEPFRASKHGLTLSLPELPTQELLAGLKNGDERKSWFKRWYSFIGGGWLEISMAEQVRALNLSPSPEIRVGVNGFRSNRRGQPDDPKKPDSEIDVCVMRGHRSYFISCTTDGSKDLCKLKSFEVAIRSRQFGGDLARAALVCLAEDTTVAKLQDEVDDVWGASNTTKVFGLSDLRTWSDYDGKNPNRDSLKKWLES
jgi:hypothetical protein